MVKYSREKVKEEMNKLISSPQLRKQAADISLESFKTFSYVDIDRKYCSHARFTQALLCKCVDILDAIINISDTIGNDNISLRNVY